MIETHPYSIFTPKDSKYLLLGSFPSIGSQSWYYSSGKSQFWRIMENVYEFRLNTLVEKKKLLSDLKMSVGDIILSCERMRENSSDNNLSKIAYNTEVINRVIIKNKIDKFYFTSRFVEMKFVRYFNYPKNTNLITLPSPSPRYARINFSEKVRVYKDLLPKMYST